MDNVGRRTILIAGGIGMAVCHFIVAGIIGSYSGDFENHRSAGWAAVAFVWIFIINFAYSWGESKLACRRDIYVLRYGRENYLSQDAFINGY